MINKEKLDEALEDATTRDPTLCGSRCILQAAQTLSDIISELDGMKKNISDLCAMQDRCYHDKREYNRAIEDVQTKINERLGE